jgi:DNA-3-methyladenine glycosylase I
MSTVTGSDGKLRCRWSGSAPEFPHYHDTEWGYPVDDDFRLFEKLSLEGFQSGLSWRTILAKRENFRAAFHRFDFNGIARFSPRDVERLLKNEGIIRHRGKIEAVINNARCAREMVKSEGSLAAFLWRYEADRQAKPFDRADLRRIHRAFEGVEETRLEIRRSHDNLRLHAGHGPGE